MNDIKLFNRDGAHLKLVPTDDDLWELEVDDEHKYILEFIRVGYNKDGKMTMIDPSGGPYLSIGQRLTKDYVIDEFVDGEGAPKIRLKSSLV